ncbi:MAG: FKBP-type peptidyl-prolyl cis-trans isomerase [Chitinophagaceae bacterium]|jgi:FKBP-type peptidyl-prolyl cis-trans isomerase|nr:FKBP-type peptidyl-prolyl cis-trans isomerase [Chitinophagaceae bacterium]
MKTITGFCIIMVAMFAFASCNDVDFKKTKGGMPYKIFSEKGGEKVSPESILKVHIKRSIGDSVLFDTRDGVAAYIPVNSPPQPYDISELFTSLKVGDSVYSVQMVDTFIKRSPEQVPPQFKNGDELISTFKVINVFKSQEEAQADMQNDQTAMMLKDPKFQEQLKKDEAVIQDYLSKNNIKAEKTGLGTFVEIIEPGSGANISSGNFVSLNYTGKTLEGKPFDSNTDPAFNHLEPLNMVVDQSPMIKGFQEGIKELKKGSKARLFIPSILAYGANSPSPDIKANENLIFEIEVLNVADEDPQANIPPPHTRADTTATNN